MRKTLVDRLAKRVQNLDGDLVQMLRNDVTAHDEIAELHRGFERVYGDVVAEEPSR